MKNDESRSFSIAGSKTLTWEIIEQRFKKIQMNNLSQYLQTLVEKDIFIEPKRIRRRDIVFYSMILLIILGLLIQLFGITL